MAGARLLVVDDEPRTAELTAELLRRAGYAVDVAGSGGAALQQVSARRPDLMLLDYEMPDMEAPEVLDQLRGSTGRVQFPVIILTGARSAPGDQVLGLDKGATDYIVKGVDRQVLLARVRSALRHRPGEEKVITRGELRVNRVTGEASLRGRSLKINRRPVLVLALLAEREGEVVTRIELLEAIWGTTFGGFEHSVEQAVHEIRRELREPGWIETKRGSGYRFVTQP